MVTAHGIEVMEAEAQLSIHDMHTLASSLGELVVILMGFHSLTPFSLVQPLS